MSIFYEYYAVNPPSLDVTVEMHMTERITGLVGVEAAKSNAFYPNMPRALLLACAMPWPYIPNRGCVATSYYIARLALLVMCISKKSSSCDLGATSSSKHVDDSCKEADSHHLMLEFSL